MPDIIISDGQPLTVRQLGLYELDGVGGETPAPVFYYEMEMATGERVKMPYDIRRIETPPAQPDDPAPAKGSAEWFALVNWQTYEAAKAHYLNYLNALEEKLDAIARYILESCVNRADWPRIKTADDIRKIYAAAVVPHVAMEDIERVCAQSFQGALGWFAAAHGVVHTREGWKWFIPGGQNMGSADDGAIVNERNAMVQAE